MILSIKVMRGDKPKLCLLVATLALGYAWAGSPCERRVTWWDRERSACQPCSRCDPHHHLIVLLPCELHRDTVCQSLRQINLWPFLAPHRNASTTDSSEPSDYEYDYTDSNSEVKDVEEQWDLQTLSVVLAASGCAIFFLVVLFVSLSHAKQWKIIKQTLQSDMKDLTAKMKLMEAGGESPSEPPSPTDHIYCNIHGGKDALLGQASNKKGLGNVYTQEKHPS
ncbi:tumor necrosis factor receptor superfamily member wengen isoform X1 [Amyelois transitella]|uniref:tumor necrosis factor receptor superfamily member wengen isoform X1 n=1 Tax=Amyelois transitella TaxID=680683 RepID=UPI00067BB8CD|nr:tumor necrosis factor receptor superfamily member wengen isoform X1 [Amyelois transitella]